MNLLVQLGNKVPLTYFYIQLALLIWYATQNEEQQKNIKPWVAINNTLYLVFSGLTVFWFVPTWWKLITPILSSETIAGTAFYNTVLSYMSAYLIITILPTLLAILFVVQKWRWNISWTVFIMLWTSPVASLLLRKIWWDVKVIWQAQSVQDAVFELNFFKHLDINFLLALLLNIGFLYFAFQFKLLPELKEKESL